MMRKVREDGGMNSITTLRGIVVDNGAASVCVQGSSWWNILSGSQRISIILPACKAAFSVPREGLKSQLQQREMESEM